MLESFLVLAHFNSLNLATQKKGKNEVIYFIFAFRLSFLGSFFGISLSNTPEIPKAKSIAATIIINELISPFALWKRLISATMTPRAKPRDLPLLFLHTSYYYM